MTQLKFSPLPSAVVNAYQAGQMDANGQVPERYTSDGSGVPCRHCLSDVKAGEPYLLLSHRPFPAAQPYAETGPIFVHAEPCAAFSKTDAVPPMIAARKQMLIRGYSAEDRICEETGQVVSTDDIRDEALKILKNPDVLYVHVRSATNNCFQCRIDDV